MKLLKIIQIQAVRQASNFETNTPQVVQQLTELSVTDLLFCKPDAANLFMRIPTPSIKARSTPPTIADPVIAIAPSEI